MMTLVLALMVMREKKPSDMVEVQAVCPEIRIELRYMTAKNGVGRAVYPRGSRCLLRRGATERLRRVQQRLAEQGFGLKIWDGYRPLSAQRALWEICPDKRFVAPPSQGSKHNRGAAVDLTLVDSKGKEVAMPCDFDTFSVKAHPDYQGGTKEQRHNRDTLKKAMTAEGFLPTKYEWWHFNDPDWKNYRLTDVSLKL